MSAFRIAFIVILYCLAVSNASAALSKASSVSGASGSFNFANGEVYPIDPGGNFGDVLVIQPHGRLTVDNRDFMSRIEINSRNDGAFWGATGTGWQVNPSGGWSPTIDPSNTLVISTDSQGAVNGFTANPVGGEVVNWILMDIENGPKGNGSDNANRDYVALGFRWSDTNSDSIVNGGDTLALVHVIYADSFAEVDSVEKLNQFVNAPPSPNASQRWTLRNAENPLVGDGGHALSVNSGTVELNEEFGHVIRMQNGTSVEIPAAAIQGQVSDRATITFWTRSEAAGNDATWQNLFRFDNSAKDREEIPVDLRWNRCFIKREYHNLHDAGNDSRIDQARWAFFAISRTPTSVKIWIDGQLVTEFGAFDVSGWDPLGSQFDRLSFGGGAYRGELSQIWLFNRELSQTEIDGVMFHSGPVYAQGNAPGTHQLSLAELAAVTGYSTTEITENFPALEDWPDWEQRSAMDPAYDPATFGSAPPPGVHPRVLFSPEDLPAMRQKFATEFLPRKQFGILKARAMQLASDDSYWTHKLNKNVFRNDPVLRAQLEAEGFTLGNGVAGYHGPWLGAMVDELATGQLPVELASTWPDDMRSNVRRYLMHVLPIASFVALIEDRDAELTRNGAALGTLARKFLEREQHYRDSPAWQTIYWELSSSSIGWVYDLCYNHMSESDRADVRRLLSSITYRKSLINNQHLPAFPANTTNWIIIHANILANVLAIEGEPGYNHGTFMEAVETLKKWYFIASGPQGAPFEGFIKSEYAPQWMPFLARRNIQFIGTTYSKNFARLFELHMMVPNGEAHVYETGIHSVSRGKTTMKSAYPNDPVLDLFFARQRSMLLDGRNHDFMGANGFNSRTTYPPVYQELFLVDNPGFLTDGVYDGDAHLASVYDMLKDSGEPLDYYSDYRGVFTARTGWDTEAIFLYMEPRNVPGGHTHGSRNEFCLASHGRLWSERPYSVEGSSEFHSVMLVDGKGQGNEGGKTPPGRTVALHRGDKVSMISGDAKPAYDFLLSRGSISGAIPFDLTPNDSLLWPSEVPWMSKPYSFLPHWFTSEKPNASTNPGHHYVLPNNPVQRAFRSAGLVRAEQPWCFVVDDFKKDNAQRAYEWQFFIQSDLQIESKQWLPEGSIQVVLAPMDASQPERLTILIPELGGREPVTSDLANILIKDVEEYQALVVRSSGISGSQVTLFIPHLAHETPPVFSRTTDGHKLSFANGGDAELRLPILADGRREVKVLERNLVVGEFNHTVAVPGPMAGYRVIAPDAFQEAGTIRWSSIPGVQYTLESCEDLNSGVWTQVQTLLAEGSISEVEVTDPSLHKIYRLRWSRNP